MTNRIPAFCEYCGHAIIPFHDKHYWVCSWRWCDNRGDILQEEIKDLKSIMTDFEPTVAYDVLSTIVSMCGIDSVKTALDEIAATSKS